jgi:hypothetical protein
MQNTIDISSPSRIEAATFQRKRLKTKIEGAKSRCSIIDHKTHQIFACLSGQQVDSQTTSPLICYSSGLF